MVNWEGGIKENAREETSMHTSGSWFRTIGCLQQKLKAIQHNIHKKSVCIEWICGIIFFDK